MLLLQLTLLFGLVLGGSTKFIVLFHRAGDEVVLPCNGVDSSETSCSGINWSYFTSIFTVDDLVINGEIKEGLPQAAKLSLDPGCSLIITNISSEDATSYVCNSQSRDDPMTFVYVFVFANSSDYIHLYHRAGDEAVLPCNSVDSSGTSCSGIHWLDNRNGSANDLLATDLIVLNGQIKEDSPRAAKLSLDHRCSLTIRNVSYEDAGQYICFQNGLKMVFLSILTPGSSDYIHLYHRAGDEAVMPCNSVDSSDTSCSRINWLYNKNSPALDSIVRDGQIEEDSPKAAKLSLDRRCSLTITNISSEDAGLYTCRYEKANDGDTEVFTSILTLSAIESLDPEGGVTLTCTLWRNDLDSICEHGSLLLLDEEGAELERNDDDSTSAGGCPSFLTITHQSNHSRQYTCQFVKDDEVKISANYPLVSTEPTPNKIIFILNIAKIFLLIILVVIVTTVQIKSRRRTGAAEDAEDQDCVPDEEDIYENVG